MATALGAGMVDGFLSRWSQRKQALREGKLTPESDSETRPGTPDRPAGPGSLEAAAPKSGGSAVGAQPPSNKLHDGVQTEVAAHEPSEKLPSLEDVKSLTPESDFSSFVARGVSPDVRNAAMKKLFADPHYSLIDGMDIYLEDYSLPSPLTAAILAKMTSAKTLKLVDESATDAAVPGSSQGLSSEAASVSDTDTDTDTDTEALGGVTTSATDGVDASTSTPSPSRPLPTEPTPLKDRSHHDHPDL